MFDLIKSPTLIILKGFEYDQCEKNVAKQPSNISIIPLPRKFSISFCRLKKINIHKKSIYFKITNNFKINHKHEKKFIYPDDRIDYKHLKCTTK